MCFVNFSGSIQSMNQRAEQIPPFAVSTAIDDEVRSEALTLITDYISRYRNRGMVNKTQSFTTMQTALNAMAGHYKNFASRPLPDKLKERLTKEFSLAEKMVLRES